MPEKEEQGKFFLCHMSDTTNPRLIVCAFGSAMARCLLVQLASQSIALSVHTIMTATIGKKAR